MGPSSPERSSSSCERDSGVPLRWLRGPARGATRPNLRVLAHEQSGERELFVNAARATGGWHRGSRGRSAGVGPPKPLRRSKSGG